MSVAAAVPFRGLALLLCVALLLPSCDTMGDDATTGTATMSSVERVDRSAVEAVLDDAFHSIAEFADSVDRLYRPVPLLTPAQEAVFLRFGNAQQLQRARALGVRPADAAALEAALEGSRLVRLEDSTSYWMLRDLTHSEPYVTPDARALLEEIGRRFHARLDALGSPRFRLEVTSVLRTPESQAELRRTNPNAALGESTHEYGTTLDVAYASFRAPADIHVPLDTRAAPWLEPYVRRMAAYALETVAARNALELRAVLGLVMAELQGEGAVMVTLERQQPVYHFTVARRMATSSGD
ncbi:MAG TPA: DUF5715 family protein [Longimicrobiales bacterium]|nr:DUF5715 family protein [Longimicrobiales bacterium]